MKSFIERNPKEKAVVDGLSSLARNGYASQNPDPADQAFAVADRLKRQSRRKRLDAESATFAP